jgi:hypothetical protein
MAVHDRDQNDTARLSLIDRASPLRDSGAVTESVSESGGGAGKEPPRRPQPPPPPVRAPARRPTRPAHHLNARLSITALIGAIWSPFFFIMLALSAVQVAANSSAADLASAVQFIVLPLGWAAPFATTVLGLLALGQIQRSQGAQYGLSLALFDALLFPLLLLDWIIFATFGRMAGALVYNETLSPGLANGLIAQFFPTAMVILLDYYLIIKAWRAVQ